MTECRAIWAVLPVKGFSQAKQRLSAGYSAEFRRRLAATMVEDVLDALRGAGRLDGVLVVTNDPLAIALADRYGAATMRDGAAGQTAAVTSAALALIGRGITGMLAVPGDIPGVKSAEIDALIDAHPNEPAFTIVPAHDERGSNAVLVTPPDLVPLAYGNDSFQPHLATARRHGIEPNIRSFEGIGLDVDNPEDLQVLASKLWRTRTHALLRVEGLTRALPTSPTTACPKDDSHVAFR